MDFHPRENHRYHYRRLSRLSWWRSLPYGYWTRPDGRHVIFDLEYDPICLLDAGQFIAVIQPGEFVPHVAVDTYYEEAMSPGRDSRTLPLILALVREYGLEDEIRLRWAVSDAGWRIGEDYPERLAAARKGARL